MGEGWCTRPQKSEKSLGESPKSLEKNPFLDFFETFRTLPETFFRLLGPEGARTFSRLFSDFWGFGPETPPPRPGKSQCYVQSASEAQLWDADFHEEVVLILHSNSVHCRIYQLQRVVYENPAPYI